MPDNGSNASDLRAVLSPPAPVTRPYPLPSGDGLSGRLVTLFGGGGFVGRHTAQALMAAGARLRIVQRHPERAHTVRALGNLGQVQFVAADAARPGAARRALAGSDLAVNFISVLSGDFQRANVDTAAAIADGARDEGCAGMVHISAIGADAASPSAYGRTKAAGEAAVRAAMPGAVILRPSIIFGRQDQFINRFAKLIRLSPIIPVVAPAVRFQPVFVGDVAAAIAAALRFPDRHAGQTYELGGPEQLSMRALFEWIAQRTGRTPLMIDVPDVASAALAQATGWLPGAPMTTDQWAMLQRDNVVSGPDGLDALGIAPTALDTVAEGWLELYRRHGRFAGKQADAGR